MVVQLGLVPRKAVIAHFLTKMSNFKLIWSSQKLPKFSFKFFDSKIVHNYTGQEFDNGLWPKLNNNFLTAGKFLISNLIDKMLISSDGWKAVGFQPSRQIFIFSDGWKALGFQPSRQIFQELLISLSNWR